MKVVFLAASLLALVSMSQVQALWLGRLDPKQFLGSWYILAMASRAKDFMVEKDMKNVEGVLVTLTPDNKLRVLSSRQGPDGCRQSTVELLKQKSRWVFENPSIGVLDYRVLGTNFKDYAVVFTQLEFGDEAFNTVELYSRTEVASYEAMKLFTKWSQGLGFRAQQQAQLRKDLTCAHKILQVGHLFCTTLDSWGASSAWGFGWTLFNAHDSAGWKVTDDEDEGCHKPLSNSCPGFQ